METIAMYWEPVIKTYGILAHNDRVLWSLTLRVGGLSHIPVLPPAEQPPQELELVTARPLGDGRMRLHLLLSRPSPLPPWTESIARECDDIQRIAPVAMVYLHGPHYGDRFGIADAALTALAGEGVTPLVSACAGASLHFVVRQEMAEAAHRALASAFVVPSALNRSISK